MYFSVHMHSWNAYLFVYFHSVLYCPCISVFKLRFSYLIVQSLYFQDDQKSLRLKVNQLAAENKRLV